MVIFIPAYDEATNANLRVISPIIPDKCISLLKQRATRENLWQYLPNNEILFVMSHGNADKIRDNDNQAALKVEDSIDFTHKKAFVFACFTANELGKQLVIPNNIYWGYTGSIAAPSNHDKLTVLFSTIFKQILINFPLCNKTDEIRQFVDSLKILCNNVENQIDLLSDMGEDVDLMSYNCLLHIWSRLRVHHFSISDTIQHPEAREGDLFE
jgi:hypothetical protein